MSLLQAIVRDFVLFGISRWLDDPDQLFAVINEISGLTYKIILEEMFPESRERLTKYLVSCDGMRENTQQTS
jgi:hypothetical protein